MKKLITILYFQIGDTVHGIINGGTIEG